MTLDSLKQGKNNFTLHVVEGDGAKPTHPSKSIIAILQASHNKSVISPLSEHTDYALAEKYLSDGRVSDERVQKNRVHLSDNAKGTASEQKDFFEKGIKALFEQRDALNTEIKRYESEGRNRFDNELKTIRRFIWLLNQTINNKDESRVKINDEILNEQKKIHKIVSDIDSYLQGIMIDIENTSPEIIELNKVQELYNKYFKNYYSLEFDKAQFSITDLVGRGKDKYQDFDKKKFQFDLGKEIGNGNNKFSVALIKEYREKFKQVFKIQGDEVYEIQKLKDYMDEFDKKIKLQFPSFYESEMTQYMTIGYNDLVRYITDVHQRTKNHTRYFDCQEKHNDASSILKLITDDKNFTQMLQNSQKFEEFAKKCNTLVTFWDHELSQKGPIQLAEDIKKYGINKENTTE